MNFLIIDLDIIHVQSEQVIHCCIAVILSAKEAEGVLSLPVSVRLFIRMTPGYDQASPGENSKDLFFFFFNLAGNFFG